jgi:hypothetical protein
MPTTLPPAKSVIMSTLGCVALDDGEHLAFSAASGIPVKISTTEDADDPANGVPLPGCIAMYAHGGQILARTVEDGPVTEIQTNAPPAVQPLATGSLGTGRRNPGVCLLADGRIFICGGLDISGTELDTCEIYDPATGLFTPTGDLVTARGGCTAVLLDNDKVLIVGSIGGAATTVEVYDPTTELCANDGTFSGTAADEYGTAIKLDSGLVLIFGGRGGDCDLYDEAGTVTATGAMSDERTGFAAFKDANGDVHAVSGMLGGVDSDTTEIYDDVGGTWSSGPDVILQREFATISIASGVPVLIGGYNTDLTAATATCEKLIAGVWTATGSLDVARYNHKSIALSDNTIFAIGGQTDGSTLTQTVELLTGETWATEESTGTARSENFCVKMTGDTALIGGGRTVIGGGTILATSEIYGAQSTVALTSDVGVTLKKITIPPTPAEGYGTAFLDVDGVMKIRKSDGTISTVGGGAWYTDANSNTSVVGSGNPGVGQSNMFNGGGLSCTGDYNLGLGSQSLSSLTSGDNNTAVGLQALQSITTGDNNVAIGQLAGNNLTVGNSNNICIGSAGVNGDSGIIRIGTTGTHTACHIAGDIGLNGATPVAQGAAIADASGGAVQDAEARTAINDLLAYLRSRGDIAP